MSGTTFSGRNTCGGDAAASSAPPLVRTVAAQVQPGMCISFTVGHSRHVDRVGSTAEGNILFWLDGSTAPVAFFPDSVVVGVFLCGEDHSGGFPRTG